MRPFGAKRGDSPWRARLRHGAATIAILLIVSFAGGAAFIWSGLYDISAIRQHTAPVFALLTTTMDRSVSRHAGAVDVPDLSSPELPAAGFAPYQESCAQCHGAPGVAPRPEGLGMTPVPTNLAQSARTMDAAEIYWVTRNGLKMTGMPAWAFQYQDQELWEITAFVESLELLSPSDYRALERANDAGRLDGDEWSDIVGEDSP